jgi:hypothetical protein
MLSHGKSLRLMKTFRFRVPGMRLTTHWSGPMGQASMFPDTFPAIGRSMRRYAPGLIS